MRYMLPLLITGLLLAIAGDWLLAGKQKDKDEGGGPDAWVGKPAPDIKLPMLDGKRFDLSTLKGKVVVLDIWATWCPPCRKSLPHIQELSANKDLAGKGLLVVAVNHGEDKPTVAPFLKENKYTFPVAMDMKKSLLAKLDGRGIPTTLVVGRDGVVKNVFVGFGPGSAEALDHAVDSALEEKSESDK